jgi:hypothetical protein
MSAQEMSRIEWPTGFDRTDPSERTHNKKFEVSLAKSFSDLEKELEKLGVDDYDYEFDARQRKRDKRPYSRANPDDPSFVVKWTMGGEQYAVACDQYTSLRDNVRAAGLYIKEKRMMENRPVTTGEAEFTNLRLPSGDEDGAVVGQEPPCAILGVEPDADDSAVRAAYRERLKEVHPDQGGSVEAFGRVKDAKEAMLGN